MVHAVKRNSHYSFILMLSLLLMHTSAHTAELVLQSIDNLDNDEFHTDEGNYFKLIKLDQGCKIEARFFISYENTLYQYFFQNRLDKANQKTYRYHYQKDHELSLLHVTDVYQHSSAQYNIDDAKVKKDFNRYRALFPNKALTFCEH